MKPTFNPGDRIRVKENGLTGTIHKVNNIYRGHYKITQLVETEYHVQWDHWHNSNSYMASDVGDMWEKIDAIADAADAGVLSLPHGIDFIPLDLQIDGIKTACDHKWVEVGFRHTKTVCYHCDMEKP